MLSAACTPADPDPDPEPTPSPTTAKLSFGVFGAKAEIAAFADIVDEYNTETVAAEVTLTSWPDRSAMQADFSSGTPRPDVFLTDRRDLAEAIDSESIQPVLRLLDERGVDFGDGYSRDALLGFSSEGELQCMPYAISPKVLYVNRDLIDFGRMGLQGLPIPRPDAPELFPEPSDEPTDEPTDELSATGRIDPSADTVPSPRVEQSAEPTDPGDVTSTPSTTPSAAPDAEPLPTYRRWSFEQFDAAVRFASNPEAGIKGIHVEPTLEGLAPFMYAIGNDLYNDDTNPTSLTFSDAIDETELPAVLQVLRDPQVTPSAAELEASSPLELFEQGKLGMLPGFRSLTPELRAVKGLNFDILPIPSINARATVGSVEGFCLSPNADSPAEAADFLVRVLSAEAVASVTKLGYRVPANLEVLNDPVFLQPDQEPANSRLFASSLRDVQLPPLLSNEAELEAAVDPTIKQLFTQPVLGDLEPLTQQVDQQSQLVLAPPEEEPSESPTVDEPEN